MTTPGFVVWFTGLPASGKSTLASATREKLAKRGVQSVVLDSDELRAVLTPEPDYSEAERQWFYGVVVYLAAWLAGNGINVLIAATAHRRACRDQARQQIERFAEVYVRCPLAVCRERDTKGIYASAEAGTAGSVPGVGVAYEPPPAPEAVVDTTQTTPAEAAELVIRQLQNST